MTPVWQKVQPNRQPTCTEMQSVTRSAYGMYTDSTFWPSWSSREETAGAVDRLEARCDVRRQDAVATGEITPNKRWEVRHLTELEDPCLKTQLATWSPR